MLADECVAVRAQGLEVGLDEFLGLLNVTIRILPVAGIDGLCNKGVPHFLHVLETARLGITLTIWRSHVGRVFANDIGNGTFILCHVHLPIFALDGVHVRMGPCVRDDLMSFGDHTLQQLGPSITFVKFAPAVVDSRDHEGGLGSSHFELVKQLICVDSRPIVESHGNSARLLAVHDVLAIRDLAEMRTGILESAWSWRHHVRVTFAESAEAVLGNSTVLDADALRVSVEET